MEKKFNEVEFKLNQLVSKLKDVNDHDPIISILSNSFYKILEYNASQDSIAIAVEQVTKESGLEYYPSEDHRNMVTVCGSTFVIDVICNLSRWISPQKPVQSVLQHPIKFIYPQFVLCLYSY